MHGPQDFEVLNPSIKSMYHKMVEDLRYFEDLKSFYLAFEVVMQFWDSPKKSRSQWRLSKSVIRYVKYTRLYGWQFLFGKYAAIEPSTMAGCSNS